MSQRETLCYLPEGNEVWLGLGQRKIVEGKRTGHGGKTGFLQFGSARIDEPLGIACRREVFVETRALALTLSHRGVLYGHLDGKVHEVHLYTTRRWIGGLRDSEEMKDHRRFSVRNLPFSDMWESDEHYLERLLSTDDLVEARFFYGSGGALHRYDITWRDTRTREIIDHSKP